MTFEEVAAELKAGPIITEYLEQDNSGHGFRCIGDGCNSGSGKKGTGATVTKDGNSLHCYSCGRYFSNIDVIAHHLGIGTTGKDFCEVVKYGAEFFGLPLDDHGYKRRARNFSTRPQKKEATMTTTKTPTPVKEEKPPVKFEEDQLDKSRANIAKIVEAGGGALKWRGLTMETMNALRWGFEPRFHYHNNPTSSAAPAVIIPNVLGGVLARSVEGYFFDGRNKDHFVPMAPTAVYLPESADFILFVTEGAINAASAWQAVKSLERDDIPALGFVATGGTPFRQQFVDWLLEKYPNTNARPLIAVAYDDDVKGNGRNPGQQAAKELISTLIGEGFVTANIILEGKAGKDLNDVLQSDGDAALGNMIVDAVAGTSDAFQACAKKIERRKVIPAWEKDNGKIEPAELEHLEADVEYLQGLTVDKITADVAGTSRTLRAVAYCRYYDFYLDVANDFMARVEKAKATAKELVKQAEPENPVDDSVQATATIATSKLSDKVDKFVAEIGKAHKEYGRQQELKARAESESKREAARAKNNEEANAVAENTTGKVFADCPLDLHIPPRFDMDENGIYCEDSVVCSTPVIVTKNLKSDGDNGEYVEIAVRDKISGTWKRQIVDKLIISDSRRIIELAARGITVISSTAKYLSEYLIRQLDFMDNGTRIPTQKIYERTGWVGDDFQKFVYPSDGGDIVQNENSGTIDYTAAFAVKGDMETWKATVLKVLASSAASRLIFGSVLAAPLVKVLGISNQWTHIAGKSGKGKTAVGYLAVSTYGDTSWLINSFDGTSNGLESNGNLFYDLPNFITEMQTATKAMREDMDRSIYKYGTGKGRLRCNKTGGLQKPKTFRGWRLSDGEQSLTTEHSGAGALKRALDFTADTVLDDDAFAAELYSFVKEHHGLAGQDWIRAIQKNIAQIRHVYDNFRRGLISEYPHAYPNHISSVAACYTAGVLFETVVLDVAPGTGIFENNACDDAKIILGSLPEKDASTNGARAIIAVADFFTAYEAYFRPYDEDEGDEKLNANDEELRTREKYGWRYRYGDVAFTKAGLETALEKFPSVRAVLREFSEAGYLDEGNDKDHPHRKNIKVKGKTRWVYVFKSSALFKDDDKSDDSSNNDDWLEDDNTEPPF